MDDRDYDLMNKAMNNDHHAEVMTIDDLPALIKARHVDGSVTVQFLRDMREVHYSEVEFLRIENEAFEGRISVWFDMYGAAKKEADRLTAENRALQAKIDAAMAIVEPQSRKSPKDYAYIDYGEGRIELAKEICKVLEGK